MDIIRITEENFEEEVINAKETVLLDFWATWCGPCQAFLPVIEEIARERPEVKVGKVDVDEQPALAERFQVMGVPTVVVMREGQVVGTTSGTRPKSVILDMLNA